MKVLCIGAGPSGLVTAKILLEADPTHEVIIVEKDATLGGTFHNKSYEDGRLVSSKYLTMFSDFRRPHAEDHMTVKDYVKYLHEYTDHHGLRDRIKFETEVVELQQHAADGGGGYTVELRDLAGGGDATTRVAFDAVAVCSGLHNYPRIPVFPGQEHFRGRILHSSEYKESKIFEGKRVLILGTGETSFDIGYAAASHGASAVTMATRHGFVSVPSAFHGTGLPPLDCLVSSQSFLALFSSGWPTHLPA